MTVCFLSWHSIANCHELIGMLFPFECFHCWRYIYQLKDLYYWYEFIFAGYRASPLLCG
jgi:hypothetical protein